ncbi:MAG: hypothetical protein AB7G21_12865 [Dehalococcoidia bacterium]
MNSRNELDERLLPRFHDERTLLSSGAVTLTNRRIIFAEAGAQPFERLTARRRGDFFTNSDFRPSRRALLLKDIERIAGFPTGMESYGVTVFGRGSREDAATLFTERLVTEFKDVMLLGLARPEAEQWLSILRDAVRADTGRTLDLPELPSEYEGRRAGRIVLRSFVGLATGAALLLTVAFFAALSAGRCGGQN